MKPIRHHFKQLSPKKESNEIEQISKIEQMSIQEAMKAAGEALQQMAEGLSRLVQKLNEKHD